MNPLFIRQCRPYMMRLRHDTFVWSEDYLRSLRVQMQCPKDQNQAAEASEALDALLPVIIEVEQKHLWLGRLENSISKFLNLKTSLKWQLKFTTFYYNVWEVKAMNFERVEHAFTSDNDLFWLFFNWQTSNQCCDLLGCFPFSKLAKTFLARPDTRVNDL